MPGRIPVYPLIDTSVSMHGTPVRAVEQVLHALAESLRTDPAALDTVVVSLISFDSLARQLVPLTRVARLSFPPLHACGTTALGEALKLLEQCISREVIAESREGQPRDSKPLVFVMTDGLSTDSWEAAGGFVEVSVSGVVDRVRAGRCCGRGPARADDACRRVPEWHGRQVNRRDLRVGRGVRKGRRGLDRGKPNGGYQTPTASAESESLDPRPLALGKGFLAA